jgi:hypothetical protein
MEIINERSVEEALTYAIEAIDNNEFERGSAALEWVLSKEPDNSIAWLWLACTTDDESTIRSCYAKAQM